MIFNVLAYATFKKLHEDCNIGFSKFAQLRPKWCVLAGSSGTHSVCVCLTHQNVKLMLEAIDYKDLMEDMMSYIVCDIKNEKCMLGKCTVCPKRDNFNQFLHTVIDNDDPETTIAVKQWVTIDRTRITELNFEVPEFIEILENKFKDITTHHYIAKMQSQFLRDTKYNLKAEECSLLLDFSENYTFPIQDAIQGYYWENFQATLHLVVAYIRVNEIKIMSMCIISDHMTHDTDAVAAFQRQIIPYLTSQNPELKKIIYFSDGSAAQYKNKKNFINLCSHEKDFNGIKAEWHFFATSHGKSPCDGIGGTVKRLVSKASH